VCTIRLILIARFLDVDICDLRWGTPFLLQLGLSEQATSLVWLAGPISGLVAQPLIGASLSISPRGEKRFKCVRS
jgi:solute carrier family 45 protein 1/2/4